MRSQTFLFTSALVLLTIVQSEFVESINPHRDLKQRSRPTCPMQFAPYVSSIRQVVDVGCNDRSVWFRDTRGNHHCGGLVISEDAILTSAACVDRRLTTNLAANPRIHVGGPNSDEPVQVRRSARIFIHESWDGKKENGYDLAIIKLNESTCVMPVRFIGRRYKEQETFSALGYGRTGTTGIFSSDNLQGANVTFIPRSICNKRFELSNRVGWDHICFQSTANGASLCTGDEGSPIVHAPFAPVYEDSLIAIASYTEGDCDESGSVAVAMNVRKFKGWIKRTLASKDFKDAE